MSTKPEPRSQPMPMDRAILWNPPAAPGARPSGRAPYPIFFQQEAVIALQEHLKSSPTQAIFGFLVGDVYRDPETGVLYTVIDKTLKLSQPIYGDKTEVVVSRLWDRMQEQLKKAAGTLLGWYHSHPGQGGFLTAHDVETHDKFFTDPWQVAILVAADRLAVPRRLHLVRMPVGEEDAAHPLVALPHHVDHLRGLDNVHRLERKQQLPRNAARIAARLGCKRNLHFVRQRLVVRRFHLRRRPGLEHRVFVVADPLGGWLAGSRGLRIARIGVVGIGLDRSVAGARRRLLPI